MARNEHERWVAFLRTHGVLPWDLKALPLADCKVRLGEKIRPNARQTMGRHAAIVPFDDLPAVNVAFAAFRDPSFDGDETCFEGRGAGVGFEAGLQWNDIKFVRWIPELVRRCGKKIVRI